jgi:iron-sulfur cluster assembly protein
MDTQTATDTTSDPITVTADAATKAMGLAESQGRTGAMLRIRVTAGGCSGFSYRLSFEDETEDDDHVIDAPGGLRVLVDERSAPIVRGATLELDRSLLGGGLKMHNPQATHECACGESFGV